MPVNNGDLLEKYQAEGKSPVRLRDREFLINKGIKLVERDFTIETNYLQHNPVKLAKTVEDFANGWVK